MTLLLISQFAPVSASKLVPVWADASVRAPQRTDIKVEMSNYRRWAHWPFISWHTSLVKASWRDINIIQSDVVANTDGWAGGGGRVSSLWTEHRGMKAQLCAARLHTAWSQAKNITRIYEHLIALNIRSKWSDECWGSGGAGLDLTVVFPPKMTVPVFSSFQLLSILNNQSVHSHLTFKWKSCI